MKIIYFQVIWKLFQQQSSIESLFKSYSTSYPLKLEVQRRVAYSISQWLARLPAAKYSKGLRFVSGRAPWGDSSMSSSDKENGELFRIYCT
jgi:hypothetical protein